MGSTPNLPPDGGRSFFDNVETDLAADVVLGNLEGTLSTGGSSKCGAGSTNCFAFQTPPSYAAWLNKAGLHGDEPREQPRLRLSARSANPQTLAALEKQRLAHTGRPGEITYQQVGDIKVAIVGFAPYPWAQPLTNIPAARRLVKKAAANADVVIVTMHAGAEGTTTYARSAGHRDLPRREPRQLGRVHARGRRRRGGPRHRHGPHVLRGMEWYHGHLIAYSLGNFAGYKVFAIGGPLSISGILRVTLRGDGGFDSGTLVPTRLVGGGMPALDPAETAHGIVRTLSKEDFGARGGQGLAERPADALDAPAGRPGDRAALGSGRMTPG